MKRMKALHRMALAVICSLAMVCTGLALVTAQAEGNSVQVQINGTEISMGSTVECDEGTATLAMEGKTPVLTLKNATINVTVGRSGVTVGLGSPIIIQLEGTNVIDAQRGMNGISAGSEITIEGNGSLEIKTNAQPGINVTGSYGLAIQDVSVTINAEKATNAAAIQVQSDLTISNASLTTSGGKYGIYTGAQDDVFIITNSNVNVSGSERGIYVNSKDSFHQPAIEISGNSDVTIRGGISGNTYYKGLKISPEGRSYWVERGASQSEAQRDSDKAYTDDKAYAADELTDLYIHIYPGSNGQASTQTAATPGAPCNHSYEWETYKAATATTDGIMRYRCKYCGEVEYSVPTAAYYVFNKETQESIQKAAQGATVTVSTPVFISFHEMVKDALAARPDVTLVVDYKNAGKSYEMTIPAGSGDQLTTLFGDSQYAGFLYLGGVFATVEQ